MLAGTTTISRFSDVIGIADAAVQNATRFFVENEERLADINSSWLAAKIPEDNISEYFYNVNDLRNPSSSAAASFCSVGKGSITALYFDAGSVYYEGRNPVIRDFLKKQIASQLQEESLVRVDGTKLVHAVATKINDKLFINLINMAGLHTNTNVFTFDEIPSLGSFTLIMNLGEKPREIYLQPENMKLGFTWKNGVAIAKIPGLEIHSVLEISN